MRRAVYPRRPSPGGPRRLWEASEQLTDVRFPLSAQEPSANATIASEAVSTLEGSH